MHWYSMDGSPLPAEPTVLIAHTMAQRSARWCVWCMIEALLRSPDQLAHATLTYKAQDGIQASTELTGTANKIYIELCRRRFD